MVSQSPDSSRRLVAARAGPRLAGRRVPWAVLRGIPAKGGADEDYYVHDMKVRSHNGRRYALLAAFMDAQIRVFDVSGLRAGQEPAKPD